MTRRRFSGHAIAAATVAAASFLAGCLGASPLPKTTPKEASTSGTASAQVLYFGGTIETMRDAASGPAPVEALVTEGDRILFVGPLGSARERAPDARPIDLAGKTLLPGFVESHVHFGVQAQLAAFDVVEPWRLENADAFIEHIAEIAHDTPPGEWIVTFGFDRVLVPPFRNLVRADLDRATTEHPVLVLYLGLHWASGNSLALERAGIDRNTPTTIPGGGITFKDEAGEPTGLFTESAVFELVHHLPPAAPEGSLEPFFEVANRMSAAGITTFADRATGATGPEELALLSRLAHDPDFPQRIAATPLYQLLPALEGPTPWDGHYQATQLKLLIDASLVGGTSATLAPQIDGQRGNLNYGHEDYRRALVQATEKGFGVTTHTMGDRGHRVLLDVYEELGPELLEAGLHTIEHSALVAEADLPRLAALDLSISHLTPMVEIHGEAMSEHVYGPERAARLYDSRTMLDVGLNVAMHSDAPVFAPRPLHSLQVATQRKTISGRVLGPDATITPYEGLRGITIDAARHLGLEAEIGSLESGKLADMVVLDRNPLSIPADEIGEIRVLRTIKGGRVVTR